MTENSVAYGLIALAVYIIAVVVVTMRIATLLRPGETFLGFATDDKRNEILFWYVFWIVLALLWIIGLPCVLGWFISKYKVWNILAPKAASPGPKPRQFAKVHTNSVGAARLCCCIPDQSKLSEQCQKLAEYQIWYGEGFTPDDYTESCAEHLEIMLDDSDQFTVLRIPQAA